MRPRRVLWPLAAVVLAVLCCSRPSERERISALAAAADSTPDAYAQPTAPLLWPGAARAFLVTSDGDLYNGDWQVRIEPRGETGPAAVPRRIAFEERWRPVVHWSRMAGAVRFDFEAVALPEPTPRDSGLLVSLLVIASNPTTRPARCGISFTIEPPDTVPAFAAFDAPDPPESAYRWARASGRDTVHGWSDRKAEDAAASAEWTLEPGASRSVRVVLPAYPSRSDALARWARVPHARRVEEVRRRWDEMLARGARFELGDPEVERALRGALVVLLGCRERRGGVWVPVGGPFHYRDVWLRDGARAIVALAVAGFTDESRALAAGLATLQWPQGCFVTQRGQLDGTGQALWAFEQSMLRPAPDDSIARFADAAVRAWRWVQWQRELGQLSGWPLGRLMPFGDPRDNELSRAQLLGNDAWTIAGYRAAARILGAAGRTREAGEVERSLERYRTDFDAALARSASRDLPPSWQNGGRDWGNLAAAYPCEALPARDPRCAALARRVWAGAGGAGLCTYGPRDTLHVYLGADLGTWALLAGRPAAADSVLSALVHWRDACGGAAELFSSSTADFGRNLPPHPSSAAALVMLVRNALVFDDRDTLELTLGARDAWWRGGRLTGAPTRWGRMDLSLERTDREARWSWTPVPVVTALTLPPSVRLATPPDPPLVASPDGRVLAPPGTASASVRITAAPEATP